MQLVTLKAIVEDTTCTPTKNPSNYYIYLISIQTEWTCAVAAPSVVAKAALVLSLSLFESRAKSNAGARKFDWERRV